MIGSAQTAQGVDVRRPVAVSRAEVGLLPRYAAVVPGSQAEDVEAPTSPVLDPATGAELSRVVETSSADVARGLAAAARAQAENWTWAGGADRTRHLLALADTVGADARVLAAGWALTTGRPLSRALSDADRLPDRAFSVAGWADKLDWAPVGRSAVGVVAVLVDWRTSPAALVETVLTALACGNAVAVRPRPAAAPLAQRLADAAERAGLPRGLLVVLPGSGAEGDAAVWAAGVGAVRAAGSLAELHTLRTTLAGGGAALSAEPDALGVDVVLEGGRSGRRAAADGTTAAVTTAIADDAFRGATAQRRAGSLLLGPPAVLDELEPALAAAAAALRPGPPLEPDTDLGPCPTPAHAQAARAALGGPLRVPVSLPAGGWWCPAGVRRLHGRRPLATPPGPLVGTRVVHSVTDAAWVLARCAGGAAVDVRVWGGTAADAAELAHVPGVRSVVAGRVLPDGGAAAPSPGGPAGGGPAPWTPDPLAGVLAQMAVFRA